MFNLYQRPDLMLFGFLIIIAWVMVWKGLALWFSAQNKQKGWFIAILILNTLGLLPIIYLLWFKPENETVNQERVKTKVSKRIVAKKKVVRKKK